MSKFEYTAHDIDGVEKSGVIAAANEQKATALLRKKGLFPKNIQIVQDLSVHAKESSAKKVKSSFYLLSRLFSVKPAQLMVFTRQMATLIEAGLPLLKGLVILERQETNPSFKKIQRGIIESIESGSTFADALAQFPYVFDRLFVNMVRAGEVGGVLGVVLERLAEYMEKAQKLKNRVVAAMTYPLVVIIVSTAIVIFLMSHIIPKFEVMFQDMLGGQALPPLTVSVMNVSDFIANNTIVIVVLFFLLFAFPYLMRRLRAGSYMADYCSLNFSPFRTLVRLNVLARFSRTLGTLMDSGVPILRALMIVKGTLYNEVVAQEVQKVHDSIKEGESMMTPIESSPVFPPIFTGMVEVGEESGKLPGMLIKIADMYEDEVDSAVSALSSIIEPVLIVLLAVVIGTIVVALFMPMTSLISNLQ